MRRLTQEEFIFRVKETHGDKYDFSCSIYKNRRSSVSFVCGEHGLVEQNAYRLIEGRGCPECGKTNKKTTTRFIKEATNKHNGIYSYDLVDYKNTYTHVSVFCNRHREYFDIRPDKHLSGQGCPKCAKRINYTWETFKEQSHHIHKYKYWYPTNQKLNTQQKIKIICSKHKEFYQLPQVHLRGHGCPECAKENHSGIYDLDSLSESDANKDSILYHIRFHHRSGRTFDKIGITVNTVNIRFSNAKKHGYRIETLRVCKDNLKNCLVLENILLDSLESDNKRYKVHDLRDTEIGGWSECFETIK